MSESIDLILDESQLTIRDLEDFHEICGMAWEEAFAPRTVKEIVEDDEGNPVAGDNGEPMTQLVKKRELPPKALGVIVWISLRRKDPTITYDQARDVQVGELRYAEPTEQTPPTTEDPEAPSPGPEDVVVAPNNPGESA